MDVFKFATADTQTLPSLDGALRTATWRRLPSSPPDRPLKCLDAQLKFCQRRDYNLCIVGFLRPPSALCVTQNESTALGLTLCSPLPCPAKLTCPRARIRLVTSFLRRQKVACEASLLRNTQWVDFRRAVATPLSQPAQEFCYSVFLR